MLNIIPQVLLHISHSTIYHSAAHHSPNLAAQNTQNYISKCCISFLKPCYTYKTAVYIIVLHVVPQILLYNHTALYIIVLHIIPHVLLHISHSTIHQSAVYHYSNLAKHITLYAYHSVVHYSSNLATNSTQHFIS